MSNQDFCAEVFAGELARLREDLRTGKWNKVHELSVDVVSRDSDGVVLSCTCSYTAA